jgi:predicted MPP superfamily phosphohydrolase
MNAGEVVHFGCVAALFAGAAGGHLICCVFSHNWWYGSSLHRFTVDLIQYLHGLILLAGPILFWWLFGFDLAAGMRGFSSTLEGIVAIYIVLCWAVIFLIFPTITVRRCLRPRPPALAAERSEIVDVTEPLGHTPAGSGNRRWQALLPFNQVFQVDFSERTLRLARLPAAWDGLTILHVSDFHFRGTPEQEFFEWVLDHATADPPDLVALTGDYVDSEGHTEWIKPIFDRLRSRVGTVGILGNHDHWFDAERIRKELESAGVRMVSNRWVELPVRDEALVVIGSEYAWLRPAPDLAGCPGGPFRLLLSHTPDNIGWAKRNGVDLMLSGHVHGGQIRFPIIGPVVMPSQYGRRYDCGVFQEGPTVLHVSRGIGGEHPLRYRCHPEVTRLILRRGTA